MKDVLIHEIISRLRRHGFVHVNRDNIVTDEVYSQYFYNILDQMKGKNKERDKAINQLLEKFPPKKK